MQYKGYELDKFQEEAIASVENNCSVVVSAPTGSGKTLIADYIINKHHENEKVVYTAPIKALSNQKYRDFCEEYGKDKVGLLTGDSVINPGAPIIVMTTEIYRNMVISQDISHEIHYVIFDEIHYINDIERGYVWEESIIFSEPHIRFLCLSATIPNAKEFADWINIVKQHRVDVVSHDKRNVPLHIEFFDAELGITTLNKIKEIIDIPSYNYIKGKGKNRRPRFKKPDHVELIRDIKEKVPCFFFTFSRQRCQDNAEQLWKAKVFDMNTQISKVLRERLETMSLDVKNLKSTRLLRRTLPYGIAFHHAGLLPAIKELIEDLFGMGLIKVLYATETFAVGINMPAKTVCFDSIRKYDGIQFRFLNTKEFFQIAGRAGRRGIDHEGFVYCMVDRRDFDFNMIKKLTYKDVDPIKSQFRLGVNTVLNLIKRHTQKEIDIILTQNFHYYQKYGTQDKKDAIYNSFGKTKKKLIKLGFVVENKVTWKGDFGSKIYADEIVTSEIFSTEFKSNLDEYDILMIVGCLAYEKRERTEVFKTLKNKSTNKLKKKLMQFNEKRFYDLEIVSALLDPIYNAGDLFYVLKNTNMLEGDVIRFFRQIIDRLGQIKKATDDDALFNKVSKTQEIMLESLKDI